jgi:1,2-phenylacetyl-CoA epoxidase catalytic subunit
VAHDQNAADQRIDEVEYQGQFHLFLADDGGEWIGHSGSLAARLF